MEKNARAFDFVCPLRKGRGSTTTMEILWLPCVAFLLLSPSGHAAGPHDDEAMVVVGGDSDGVVFTMGHLSLGSPGDLTEQKGVELRPYEIDAFPVTNRRFRKFVRATKYKTESGECPCAR